jgi:hypothetical protein
MENPYAGAAEIKGGGADGCDARVPEQVSSPRVTHLMSDSFRAWSVLMRNLGCYLALLFFSLCGRGAISCMMLV